MGRGKPLQVTELRQGVADKQDPHQMHMASSTGLIRSNNGYDTAPRDSIGETPSHFVVPTCSLPAMSGKSVRGIVAIDSEHEALGSIDLDQSEMGASNKASPGRRR
jgi:hypothetical protein